MIDTMLNSPKWTAIYRGGRNGSTSEIVVNSIEKPAPKRNFRAAGVGRLTFEAVSITQLQEPAGGFMAKKKKRTKKAKEELEGLEGLEEDLEELEEEEPEEEEEELEEEEDEKPKRKRKKKASKKSKKKSSKKSKRQPPVRELPAGKVGVERIAELSGKDERAIRLWLRKNEIEKKDGRYAFTEKQAKSIASKIKKGAKARKDEDDE